MIDALGIYAFIFLFFFSQKMVSRRKILSRSRDDLSVEQPYVPEEEEDVWYQKDKLFKVSISSYFARVVS